jgi:hypothetical protein
VKGKTLGPSILVADGPCYLEDPVDASWLVVLGTGSPSSPSGPSRVATALSPRGQTTLPTIAASCLPRLWRLRRPGPSRVATALSSRGPSAPPTIAASCLSRLWRLRRPSPSRVATALSPRGPPKPPTIAAAYLPRLSRPRRPSPSPAMSRQLMADQHSTMKSTETSRLKIIWMMSSPIMRKPDLNTPVGRIIQKFDCGQKCIFCRKLYVSEVYRPMDCRVIHELKLRTLFKMVAF